MNLLLSFIAAMLVTMALVPLLTRFAVPLGVLDAPSARKVHREPVPRVGGIAMMTGVLLALLPWLLAGDPKLRAVLLGGGIVFLFGFADDRADLSPQVKLAGQLLAIAVVVGFGDVVIGSVSLTERHELPGWIGLPLTALFMLGVTNAINLADGLDGLAGGTTLLSMLALGMLGLTVGHSEVCALAFAFSGAILGFLRFNTFPARIFMGDSGSQLLGFMVAVVSVMFSQQASAPVSSAVPLLLLGLPVVDTLMVMAQRWREGQSIFAADQRHVHHKLLDLGFDHHEAVVVIYGIQALFFLSAWFMRYEPDPAIIAAFIALAVGVVGMLVLAGRSGWRWRRVHLDLTATFTSASRLRLLVHWLVLPEHLPRWTLRTAGFCVLGYLAAVGLKGATATMDLAGLAGALALVLAATVFWPQGRPEWLARGALYIAVTVAVYLDHQTVAKAAVLQATKWVLLPLLVVCVVLRIRLSWQRRFEFSALDVLLIFVALAVPNLPGLSFGAGNVGVSIAKLVALFYAVELLGDQSVRGRLVLGAGVIGFLLLVLMRAGGLV